MEDDRSERPSKRPKLSQDDNSITLVSTTTSGEDGVMAKIADDPREIEVGITAFVSDTTEAFSAILKTRYTDFLVNEILPGGDVVHLHDTAVPDKFRSSGKTSQKAHRTSEAVNANLPQSALQDPAADDKDKDQSNNAINGQDVENSPPKDVHWISEADKQQLIQYLNPGAVSELLSLHQSIIKHPQRKPREHPLVRTEFTNDRSIRAEIHGCIRKVFHSRIESSTDKDGYLVLTAASPGNRQNNPRNANDAPSWRPSKAGWDERGGEYLHFTLYKENKDTMEAISWLVRQMKVNAKIFQFAGTKDRRAVTSQRVSAHRIDAGRLAGQNKSLRGARVGDFEYLPHGLELGDLAGNEFTITLRECEFSGHQGGEPGSKIKAVQQSLEKAMTSLHHQGYLNYFGLQRFGTFAASTDTVGLHILKGDYQAAVEAIMHFDSDAISNADKASIKDNLFDELKRDERSEDSNRALALLIFKASSNFQKAIDILPRKFSAEVALMRHLHRQPTDFLGALMSITRNLKLMYVHAYQSLVWNNAVTHRMAEYGSTVVEGDLVMISEHHDKTTPTEASNPTDIDADGEIIVAPSGNDRATNVNDAFERARHLTTTEASSGKYTIFDIVLPLPGYDILYPDHATGAFYKTFMADHGGLDPMDMRRKQRDFSLSGSYRKILSRIGNDWTMEVKTYTRDDEQFVKTDLDVLKDRDQTRAGGLQQQSDTRDNHDVHNSSEGGSSSLSFKTGIAKEEELHDENVVKTEEKIAAILKFKLGSSQYATMALRELSRGGITAYKPDYSGLRVKST